MAYIRDSAGGVILRGMQRRETPRPDARGARHRWLLAVLAVILLSTFGLAGSGGAGTAYDDEELKFVGLINDYREQNGLRPVILSDALAVAAERHSKDMAEYGFFAHNHPPPPTPPGRPRRPPLQGHGRVWILRPQHRPELVLPGRRGALGPHEGGGLRLQHPEGREPRRRLRGGRGGRAGGGGRPT